MLPFFIASRLSLSSAGRRGTSPAVKVAVAAVALSVLVMMVAVAVVLGFKQQITDKVAGFNSHVTIVAADADPQDSEPTVFSLTPSLSATLDSLPFITGYSLNASVPALLKTPGDFKGVYLRSLSGRDTREFLQSGLATGTLPDFSIPDNKLKIVVSRKIADRLGLEPGQKTDAFFFTDEVRARRLEIAAVYDSHFDQFDENYIYGALPLIQELGNLSPARGTSLSVSVDNFDNIDEYTQIIQTSLIRAYTSGEIYKVLRAQSARELGAGYFQWLDLLDMNAIVIIVLMTLVAMVTLISGMLILMVDKNRLVALLTALGAPSALISRVFVILAARIALVGLAIGDILSLLLIFLQDYTHFAPLDAESYYIDFVPVKFSLPVFIALNIAVMAVILLSLWLPSRFVRKVAPARVLAAD